MSFSTYYNSTIVPIMIGSLISSIVFGIICSTIASSKNRSAISWFFLGFFFGLIGLICVICAEKYPVNNNKYHTNKIVEEKNAKINIVCSRCGNQINMPKEILNDIDTIVCAKCQNEINLKQNLETKEDNFYHIPNKSSYDDMFVVECPKCNESLVFPNEDIEKNYKFKCPYCNADIIID